MSHTNIWGKIVLGRQGQCKGPERGRGVLSPQEGSKEGKDIMNLL